MQRFWLLYENSNCDLTSRSGPRLGMALRKTLDLYLPPCHVKDEWMNKGTYVRTNEWTNGKTKLYTPWHTWYAGGIKTLLPKDVKSTVGVTTIHYTEWVMDTCWADWNSKSDRAKTVSKNSQIKNSKSNVHLYFIGLQSAKFQKNLD